MILFEPNTTVMKVIELLLYILKYAAQYDM